MKHVWHSAPAAASNCKQGLLMMTLPSPHALRTECIVKQIDKVAVSSQDTVRSRTADTTHSHRVVHVSSQAQKAATTAASVHVSASGQYSVYASQRHHWKLITSLSANIHFTSSKHCPRRIIFQVLTSFFRSQRPSKTLPPQATVSSMMLDPANVPTPMLICRHKSVCQICKPSAALPSESVHFLRSSSECQKHDASHWRLIQTF